MSDMKSSISHADSYEAIGSFGESHDLAENWEQTEAVEFEVDLQSHVTYYALDSLLSSRVREVARQRGVSAQTILNLWVQEKLQERELG
jgi:hypothetical protein